MCVCIYIYIFVIKKKEFHSFGDFLYNLKHKAKKKTEGNTVG